MEVILLQDVEHLGHVGDVVKIKDGYGRNYLLPRKLAVHCTSGNLKAIAEEKKLIAKRLEKEKGKFEQLAEKIAATSCTIVVQTGDDEKLYGSVTNTDIHNALIAEGIDIDKRKIELEEPIKALGVYTIPIKLHPAVHAALKVWVVKK